MTVGLTREMEVTSGGATFTVLCTHFGLDSAERQAQAQRLDEIGRTARYPCLIAGDLNEGPEGPCVRWLEAAGWRHSVPPVEPTFPSTVPRVRIDHVLLGAGLRCERGWVSASEASDHLPVGAEEVEYEVVMKASGILDAYIFHRLCYDAWVAACGSSR